MPHPDLISVMVHLYLLAVGVVASLLARAIGRGSGYGVVADIVIGTIGAMQCALRLLMLPVLDAGGPMAFLMPVFGAAAFIGVARMHRAFHRA